MCDKKVVRFRLDNGEWRSKVYYSPSKEQDDEDEGPKADTKNDSVWSKPKYDTKKYAGYIESLMGKEKEKEPDFSFEKEIFNKPAEIPNLRPWDIYNNNLAIVNIKFSDVKHKKYVSDKSLDILRRIAVLSGNNNIKITNTYRTPMEQAQIMYNFLEINGIAHQRRLYGKFGDLIIDVYEKNQNLPKEKILKLMTDKINEVGAYNVSHHLGNNFSELNVFDIGYSSFENKSKIDDFYNTIIKYKSELSIFAIIKEDGNRCLHLEIKQ